MIKVSCLGLNIDNLDPPDLIEAPEKIAFFQSMLEKLEQKYDWKTITQMGNVPQETMSLSPFSWRITQGNTVMPSSNVTKQQPSKFLKLN